MLRCGATLGADLASVGGGDGAPRACSGPVGRRRLRDSHAVLGWTRCVGHRYGLPMESSRPSLAFDLLRTDLEDAGSLTDFIVAHTISPARAAYRLLAPRPNEGQKLLRRADRDHGRRAADTALAVVSPRRVDPMVRPTGPRTALVRLALSRRLWVPWFGAGDPRAPRHCCFVGLHPLGRAPARGYR